MLINFCDYISQSWHFFGSRAALIPKSLINHEDLDLYLDHMDSDLDSDSNHEDLDSDLDSNSLDLTITLIETTTEDHHHRNL